MRRAESQNAATPVTLTLAPEHTRSGERARAAGTAIRTYGLAASVKL